MGRRLCIIFVVCSDWSKREFYVRPCSPKFKYLKVNPLKVCKKEMKKLLQTLWSKDYLTDEHLTGFDNYKVSSTVALPNFVS